MKLLKKLALASAAIVVVLLVIALFLDREYAVQRDIVINKPKAEVFQYIRHLKNQERYSKWVMQDPAMHKTYHGTDGTVGFVYGWNGNDQAGEGEQEIKGILEGERLDVEIRFVRPMAVTASTPMTTQALNAHQTKVTWGMKSASPYPLNLMNVFMDALLGKDLETSLTTLKGILEQQQFTAQN